MTNAVAHAGTIHIGDLNLWTFPASAGSNISVDIAEVLVGETDPGFVPGSGCAALTARPSETRGARRRRCSSCLRRPADSTPLSSAVRTSSDGGTVHADGARRRCSALPSPVPTTIADTRRSVGRDRVAVSAMDRLPVDCHEVPVPMGRPQWRYRQWQRLGELHGTSEPGRSAESRRDSRGYPDSDVHADWVPRSARPTATWTACR